MTRCLLILGSLSILTLPCRLEAQWWDAQLPRGGELQVGLTGENLTADHVFIDGNSQPSTRLFGAQLDARLISGLDTLDDFLARLYPDLGLPLPEPSHLGDLQFDVLFERTRAPISLTFGTTDWLAAFVVVPIVKSVSSAAPGLDSLAAVTGYSETAFGGPGDNTLFDGLAAGIAELEGIVASDTLPVDRQLEAELLLADARTLEAGLTGLRDGRFAPTNSGAPGLDLLQYYGALRSGFGNFEITLPGLSLASPVDPADAVGEVPWSELGIEPLQNRSTGIKFGDVEAGLSLQPYNSFRERADRPPSRFPIRVRLDGLYRFATGSPPVAGRLTDAGTGDGQPDIELRTTIDAGFGRRFWLSAHLGYTIQMAAEVERLVTSPRAPIQLGAYKALVRWDPGDVLTFAAVPRFNFTQTITFSGLLIRTRRGRDSVEPVTPVGEGAVFEPSDLEEGTSFTATAIGFGARYSTTHWGGQRRSGIPWEVEFRYLRTTSVTEGLAPQRNVWQIGLRYYLSVFR